MASHRSALAILSGMLGLIVTTGLASTASTQMAALSGASPQASALIERLQLRINSRSDVLRSVPDVFHFTDYKARQPGFRFDETKEVDADACATATEIVSNLSAVVADTLAGTKNRAVRNTLLDELDATKDTYCA